ncbi:hypothetical protein Hanom_Chr00s000004g01610571 [Helianthus anomalus]
MVVVRVGGSGGSGGGDETRWWSAARVVVVRRFRWWPTAGVVVAGDRCGGGEEKIRLVGVFIERKREIGVGEILSVWSLVYKYNIYIYIYMGRIIGEH